ncbi:unnamed protein product, partial [Staurois parvus]
SISDGGETCWWSEPPLQTLVSCYWLFQVALTMELCWHQGRTDNSWGPQAIGDHGAPVSLPTLKAHPKKPITNVPGASHGAPY